MSENAMLVLPSLLELSLIPWDLCFTLQNVHHMTVETFYLGLVISSSITPIDSDLPTSSLEIPSCSHAQ
ncbi:hypothetical protein Tco_0760471 [Tanacetum coccineum]